MGVIRKATQTATHWLRHARSAQECARSPGWPAHRSHWRPWRSGHRRCVRCENQPPQGVETAGNPRESEGGIDAGEPGGGEPPRRLMRAAVRTEPQAVVRSTLPEAAAEVSARLRAPVRCAVRSSVRGEAGTGDAGGASATSRGEARGRRSRPGRARRGPRGAWRTAPARGDQGGGTVEGDRRLHRGVGRHAAVSEASRRASVSAQRAKRAEARGIAAEIDRREIAA